MNSTEKTAIKKQLNLASSKIATKKYPKMI